MAATNLLAKNLRDTTIQRIVNNFPNELILAPQWVLWKLEQRGGKLTKIPYQSNGLRADSTSSATWSDFQSVMRTYTSNASYSGIGFVFTEDDPYIGIDLDKCRDPDSGDVEPWAAAIVKRFDTYAELSPSGKGFHIIGKANLPAKGRRKGALEMYESGRYFTVTGDHYGASPLEAKDIQTEITALHRETFGAVGTFKAPRLAAIAANVAASVGAPVANPGTDQTVVDAILASSDGATFKQFHLGNWAILGYASQSEGDLAFTGMMARHAGVRPEQIDRLFRTSGMMRDKWDEMRGTQTYGEMTIAKGLEGMQSDLQANAFILKMNERYALITVGNQIKILDRANDIPDFKLLSRADFALQTANLRSPQKSISAANLWLQSPHRSTFNGLVFSPAKDVAGSYNLWRGFSIVPVAGRCTLFWDFVLQVICAGDATIYAYIRLYFAHMIQRPWERPEVAIVFRGGQGTGKNTFVDTMGALVANHFRQVNSMDQITGRFNGHMQHVILLHANEATWGGNKSDKGKLKAMITDATVPVEMKGLDIVDIDNYLRLMISSNEDWPVPIDVDDRRFLVLDVSPIHKQDQAYFGAIHAELNNGGREALMHDLTVQSLAGFSPRDKPASPFGADMKLRSADSPTRWLFDFLNDNNWLQGGKVFAQIGVAAEVAKSVLYADYEQWNRGSPDRYTASREQFFTAVRRILGETMADLRPSAKPGEARERKFVFSNIASCRTAFETATGTKGGIEWEPM